MVSRPAGVPRKSGRSSYFGSAARREEHTVRRAVIRRAFMVGVFRN
jgi:hypothetical protein